MNGLFGFERIFHAEQQTGKAEEAEEGNHHQDPTPIHHAAKIGAERYAECHGKGEAAEHNRHGGCRSCLAHQTGGSAGCDGEEQAVSQSCSESGEVHQCQFAE